MPKAFIVVSESNFRMLEYLHTYRFLTAPQFLRLGLAEHIDSVHSTLRGLIAGGHVDFVEFGVAPGIGRLPRVYYLTARGAECLAEAWRVDPKTINYPKGGRVFRHDYFHRRATIDFQIELRLFTGRSGAGVDFFHSYFDTMGANRNADPAARLKRLTKLPLGDRYFIPDAIFGVDAPNGSRFLYVLEVHNGSDTKRACGQLEKHRIALREGCFSDLYHYPKAHRVLCVFEHDNALQAVTQRLRADAAFMEQRMQSQFAFSTLPALRQDFATGWEFLEPDRACIFDA